MARIRTIKPEFWTDEKLVRMPYEARLLFVGLWNFADDHGVAVYSPDRLKMMIFPADDVNIAELIDLLVAAEMLDYLEAVNEDDSPLIRINNWKAHQKVDNPAKSKFPSENYRKLAIRNEDRLAVARKYGCEPGMTAKADCFYCGAPGVIHWWNSNGKPTRWVSISDLEFDHFVPEFHGGEGDSGNLVLACRSCNRAKGTRNPIDFLGAKIETSEESREEYRALPPGKERKGRETETERKGTGNSKTGRNGLATESERMAAGPGADQILENQPEKPSGKSPEEQPKTSPEAGTEALAGSGSDGLNSINFESETGVSQDFGSEYPKNQNGSQNLALESENLALGSPPGRPSALEIANARILEIRRQENLRQFGGAIGMGGAA